MEKTGGKIISGAPTTLAVEGLMMMMMKQRRGKFVRILSQKFNGLRLRTNIVYIHVRILFQRFNGLRLLINIVYNHVKILSDRFNGSRLLTNIVYIHIKMLSQRFNCLRWLTNIVYIHVRILSQRFNSLRLLTNIVYIHRHLCLSLNCRDLGGTTDDFSTSFLHFSLFCSAHWALVNSRPVYIYELKNNVTCYSCVFSPLFFHDSAFL